MSTPLRPARELLNALVVVPAADRVWPAGGLMRPPCGSGAGWAIVFRSAYSSEPMKPNSCSRLVNRLKTDTNRLTVAST